MMQKQNIIGIYKITSPTGRIYIGQSRDIKRRFATYKKLRCISQPKLYASFQKHGVENHAFEILIQCDEALLNENETKYITACTSSSPSHLNCRMDGVYQIASQQTRNKISRFWKGRKRSVANCLQMSIAMTGKPSPKKGKKANPLSVEKQRLAITGKMIGELNPFFGKKHTSETLQKMIGKSKGVGAKNVKAKLVINLQTGIFYDTAGEASCTTPYKEQHFRGMLNGNKKNKTYFVYA